MQVRDAPAAETAEIPIEWDVDIMTGSRARWKDLDDTRSLPDSRSDLSAGRKFVRGGPRGQLAALARASSRRSQYHRQESSRELERDGQGRLADPASQLGGRNARSLGRHGFRDVRARGFYAEQGSRDG